MAGLLLGYHLTVFVAVIFQRLMHLAAPPTIRHNNIQHRFFPKLVMTSRLNIISNHLPERILGTGLQFVMIMPALISVLLVLGGNHHQHAFFDVCMLNSLAPSTLGATYCRHEQEKHRAYKERVRKVEYGCFTSLVFLTTGGMGKAATVMNKRLSNLLYTC